MESLDYRDFLDPMLGIWIQAPGSSEFQKFNSRASELVKSVEIVDDLKNPTKDSHIKVTLVNPRLSADEYLFSDNPSIFVGGALCVFFSSGGKLFTEANMLSGQIREISPEFNEDGSSYLVITAHSLSNKLADTREGKKWDKSLNGYQIAEEVAKKHNLKVCKCGEPPSDNANLNTDRVQPDNTSDFAFLTKLAADINYECYVQNNILHFHKKETRQSNAFVLSYGMDDPKIVKSVKIKAKNNVASKGSIRGVDAKTKKPFEVKSNPGDVTKRNDKLLINQRTGGSSIVDKIVSTVTGGSSNKNEVFESGGSDFGMSESYKPSENKNNIIIPTSASKEVATEKLKARLQRSADKSVEISVECLGHPYLRAGRIVQLVGVGPTYSGYYRIAKATHKFEGAHGYTCSLELNGDSVGGGGSGSSGSASDDASSTSNPSGKVTPGDNKTRVDQRDGSQTPVEPIPDRK